MANPTHHGRLGFKVYKVNTTLLFEVGRHTKVGMVKMLACWGRPSVNLSYGSPSAVSSWLSRSSCNAQVITA